MPASINDKFRKVYQTFSTTLSAQKALAAGTMSLSSATGVPTDTAVDFTVGRVDANGTRTPSAKAVYKGTLSGTTVSNLTLIEGTDQLHNAGTVVEITWTATTWNNAVDAILTQHNQDGTHGVVTATSVSTDTVLEKTAAAGVTIDGLNIKDSTINTANSVNGVALNSANGEFASWVPSGNSDTSSATFVAWGNGTATLSIPTWATKARISATITRVECVSSAVATEFKLFIGADAGRVVRFDETTSTAARPLAWNDQITLTSTGSQTLKIDAARVSGTGAFRVGTISDFTFIITYHP